MKIGTMSIVCGTTACNAKCPFCVSKMTPTADFTGVTEHTWRNLEIACKLAQNAGATTCLITGKGEPTLYPSLIKSYIRAVKNYFPFIELQTNGMKLYELAQAGDLHKWYHDGLSTVCISAVETGFANKKIYGIDYPSIEGTAKLLNEHGFTIRLSIMMLEKYICRPSDIDRLVNFCKENKIKQLTVRPISRPQECNNGIAEWIDEHRMDDKRLHDIKEHIKKKGTSVLKLAHGATIYDFEGQNICFANCLTTNETDENIRQIIFYPDGTIGYDWKYEGAILL